MSENAEERIKKRWVIHLWVVCYDFMIKLIKMNIVDVLWHTAKLPSVEESG